MKISKLLVLSVFLALACSKSESPALEKTQLNVTPVTPPTAMSSSQDTHAQEANGYIIQANVITSMNALFTVPAGSGATKSSPITATNGRTAASNSTTVTYVWSDPNAGSIGYQITDDGTSYHWEYFYKAVGAITWLKWIDAVQKKDGSTGTMKIFDFNGSNPSYVAALYQWTQTGDQLTLTYTDNFGGDYFVLNYNKSTKAGSINAYTGTGTSALLAANYTWDTTGHGTWKVYGSDGKTVTGSGTW